MNERRSNPDFLNGVPELLILRLLSTRPMHGYQIVQAIKSKSRETLQFGEGCIYPILHKLEKDAFLSSKREIAQGRSRIVYRLTAKGTRRLADTQSTWKAVASAIGAVLDDGGGPCDVSPAMA